MPPSEQKEGTDRQELAVVVTKLGAEMHRMRKRALVRRGPSQIVALMQTGGQRKSWKRPPGRRTRILQSEGERSPESKGRRNNVLHI
jgi:hypothetical protein